MNKNAIAQALALMDAHIYALNRRDSAAIAATLHFPHHRLVDTRWTTWDTAEHYLHDFLQRAGSRWARSTFNDIKVLYTSASKVHLDAEIRRFDHSDQLITRFRSLWVIIEIDGVWAAKVRSSFAAA